MDAQLSKILLASAMNPSTDPINEPAPAAVPIDDNVKQAWNDYTAYLNKKGLMGSATLDAGDTGLKTLAMYQKANPNSILTKEHIPVIQQAFSDYRGRALADIKSGKATGPKNPDETFMPGLSKIDGIPGSMTTSYQFPAANFTHQIKDANGRVISSTTDHQKFAKN